jgi:hypothetical protein
MKRWPLVCGVLLLAAGAWLWSYPPSLPKERELLRIGEWRATVEGRERLPGWVAPLGVGLGAGLLLAGLLRRR